MTNTMTIIEDILSSYGMAQIDIDHLMAKFLEEESLDYIDAMISISDEDVISKIETSLKNRNNSFNY